MSASQGIGKRLVSTRISGEVWKRVRGLVVEKDLTLEEAVEGALREWVERECDGSVAQVEKPAEDPARVLRKPAGRVMTDPLGCERCGHARSRHIVGARGVGCDCGRCSSFVGEQLAPEPVRVREVRVEPRVAKRTPPELLAVDALFASGLLKTGAQLKAEQEAAGGTNREAIKRRVGGDGSGERGGEDAGARGEGAGEAGPGAWGAGVGVRPSGDSAGIDDGELGGSGDFVPGNEAVQDVRGAGGVGLSARERERQRIAHQDYLRTHPEDESQDDAGLDF